VSKRINVPRFHSQLGRQEDLKLLCNNTEWLGIDKQIQMWHQLSNGRKSPVLTNMEKQKSRDNSLFDRPSYLPKD
jgi:hypothetical protein